MNKFLPEQTILPRAYWILGVTLMAAIPGLSYLEPASASSLACATGANWVSTCQSGIYEFQNTETNSLNIFSPNNQPDFQITRFGLTRILIGNPVDAIVGDPILGDVGTLDGQLDVIQFEIFSSFSSGDTPIPIQATFTSGDGVPDLASTPADPIPPYESLYTAGAIFQRHDDPTLADSFLKLFLDVQGGSEGPIRNQIAISAIADAPLTGFPTDITYVSRELTPLLTAGSDGVFWTGDEVEYARIVPGADGVAARFSLRRSIPEPSTVLSSLLIGLGMVVGCKKREPTDTGKKDFS